MNKAIITSKNGWRLAILAAIMPIIAVKACAQNLDVTIQAVDQDKKPLAGVVADSESQGRLREKEGALAAYQPKLTDHNGIANLLSRKKSMTERLYLKKEGYYNTRSVTFSPLLDETYPPEKPIPLEIKKVVDPIAMYAKNTRHLKLPTYDGKKYGYDLMSGDWVQPDGDGKFSDLIFSFEGIAWRPGPKVVRDVYDQRVILTFSNEEDGIIPFLSLSEDGWRYGSELVSNYRAPEIGYQREWITRSWREKGGFNQTTKNIDRCFYFRVRTKLDENGNIVSAHYGKIYGDFMSFIHYFNPNPNDRNVEFDPKKNLMENLDQWSEVDRP